MKTYMEQYAQAFSYADAGSIVLATLNDIRSDGSIPAEMSAHASYLLSWLQGEVEEKMPPKPAYSKCNAGHELQLIKNLRGEFVWDCPTCIRKMLAAHKGGAQ